MNVTFSPSKVWNNEGVIDVAVGAKVSFACVFPSTVTGTPTAIAEKGGQVLTSTVFAGADSVAVADKTVTLKLATFGASGTYVITITCTIGSETVIGKIQVRVQKTKATR